MHRSRSTAASVAFATLLVAGLSTGHATSRAETPRPGGGLGGLTGRLERIFGAKDVAAADIGVSVIEVATGKVLWERGADRPLSLASNTKLVTTACALEKLGPGYRFETTLSRRGEIRAGTLHGDLIVTGGGDPCMGARFDGTADAALRRFGRALREAGVRAVTGGLIADDRLFDRERQHPEWPRDQLDRWYAAPVSALTLNDACIDITVSPGARAGLPAVVTLAPMTALLELELRCGTTADRKEHVVDIGRRPGAEKYVVRGQILAASDPVVSSIAVFDPSLVFASVMKERLADEGVAIAGPARVVAPDEALADQVPLAAHASLLAQALPVVNKRSQNHVAEQLLKTLGAVKGAGGSFAGGAAVEAEFLASLGVAKEKISLVDGSGLARGNKLPASAVTTLLAVTARGKHGSAYLSSMAVAGQDGTLEKRLKAPALAGRVFAKTGTINAVSALSGYVAPRARPGLEAPPPGSTIAFSVLVNRCPGGAGRARRLQDDAVQAIAVYLDDGASPGAGEDTTPPASGDSAAPAEESEGDGR